MEKHNTESVNCADEPAPMTLKQVGKIIRMARREAGYTSQAAFAAAAGLSHDIINDIENGRGKAGFPAYDKVARFLGITFPITFPVDEKENNS